MHEDDQIKRYHADHIIPTHVDLNPSHSHSHEGEGKLGSNGNDCTTGPKNYEKKAVKEVGSQPTTEIKESSDTRNSPMNTSLDIEESTTGGPSLSNNMESDLADLKSTPILRRSKRKIKPPDRLTF